MAKNSRFPAGSLPCSCRGSATPHGPQTDAAASASPRPEQGSAFPPTQAQVCWKELLGTQASDLPPSVLEAGRVAFYFLPPHKSRASGTVTALTLCQASCWANGPPLPRRSVEASSQLKPDLRLDIPQSQS